MNVTMTLIQLNTLRTMLRYHQVKAVYAAFNQVAAGGNQSDLTIRLLGVLNRLERIDSELGPLEAQYAKANDHKPDAPVALNFPTSQYEFCTAIIGDAFDPVPGFATIEEQEKVLALIRANLEGVRLAFKAAMTEDPMLANFPLAQQRPPGRQ